MKAYHPRLPEEKPTRTCKYCSHYVRDSISGPAPWGTCRLLTPPMNASHDGCYCEKFTNYEIKKIENKDW